MRKKKIKAKSNDYFVSFSEVMDLIKEENCEWKKDFRVGDVKLDKIHKTIDLLWDNHCYDIELSRITTPVEAFHWVCHLHEKGWVTPEMLNDFIEVIKRSTTVNEYCNPDMWETYDKDEKGVPGAL